MWADELSYVLWAYRTMQRVSMDETAFNLAFETEVAIPLEIGIPFPRVENFDEDNNLERLRESLDLLEEVHE